MNLNHAIAKCATAERRLARVQAHVANAGKMLPAWLALEAITLAEFRDAEDEALRIMRAHSGAARKVFLRNTDGAPEGWQ